MTKVTNQTEDNELLTVKEVAQKLRVDDTTVRRWIKSNALEAITLPHLNKRQAYRVRRETLNKLVNGQQQHVEEKHEEHHNGHRKHSSHTVEAVRV